MRSQTQSTPGDPSQNRYILARAAARRARHLYAGVQPLGVSKSLKPCRVAVDEIRQGSVQFCATNENLIWAESASGGNLSGVDDAEQFAAQRRALLREVKRITRELQLAERRLRMARTDSWPKVTRSVASSVEILKAQLVVAEERLAAFDKDLGND